MIEVRGEQFDEGSNYAQVTRPPMGQIETSMRVEHLEDLREIQHALHDDRNLARWLLTEAQGNTFVDVEFGMDPIGLGYRIFDATFGKLYFRRWLEQSLAALEDAAARPIAQRDPRARPAGVLRLKIRGDPVDMLSAPPDAPAMGQNQAPRG